jgi:hypothetical protein
MIDDGWLALVAILLFVITVAAGFAAINLGRIAEALEVVPSGFQASVNSCASIKTPLESIWERYELLTDAQAGPIEYERGQESRRREETQWANLAEQVRKGEITLGGEEVPSAPEEREAWLAAKTASYREMWDHDYGPTKPPAVS